MNTPAPHLREFVAGYLEQRGLPSEGLAFNALAGDGSKRLFWRVTLPQSAITFIAVENEPTDPFSKRENLAYLKIGKHLFEKGLPVPEIHRFDLAYGWFILEDMGETSLQDISSTLKDRISLYEKVVEILFRLQTEGSEGFNPQWCCQTERYDQYVMRRYEADYFRDAFLVNYLGLKKDWPELERPFDHLTEMASKADSRFFLHRDFQSRNIMLSDDRMGILDWQGARLGPLPYDLASLLIDPYTALSFRERTRFYRTYLEMLQVYKPELVDPFERTYPYLAIQRNLQILGAFSYLTKAREKPYFEAYIPPALKSLRRLLKELSDPRLSALNSLLESLHSLK